MTRAAPFLASLLACAVLGSGTGALFLVAPLALDGSRSVLGGALRAAGVAAGVGALTLAGAGIAILSAAVLALRPWESSPPPRRHAPMEIPE